MQPNRSTVLPPWMLLSALLGLSALQAGCGQSDAPNDAAGAAASAATQKGASASEAVTRVRAASVMPAEGLAALAFPGETRGASRGSLTFQVSGRLESRKGIGQSFAAGDVLASLSNPELEPAAAAARQQLAQAQSQRAQAARDLQRVESLRSSGAATIEELEKTRAALTTLDATVAAARAQLARANSLLSETKIVAPFSGTVSQVFFEPGEFVTPGRPVLSVAGGSGLEVEIPLTEALVLQRSVGEALQVRFPFLGVTVEGRIAEVAAAAPGAGRLFPLVVSIPSALPANMQANATATRLRAGLSAEVLVPSAAADERTVPLRAVVDPGSGEPRVYAVRNEGGETVVRAVPVSIGDIVGERVLVGGEIAMGDRVVTDGVAGLIDGERVEVVQ